MAGLVDPGVSLGNREDSICCEMGDKEYRREFIMEVGNPSA
jgi:hypothetical protein